MFFPYLSYTNKSETSFRNFTNIGEFHERRGSHGSGLCHCLHKQHVQNFPGRNLSITVSPSDFEIIIKQRFDFFFGYCNNQQQSYHNAAMNMSHDNQNSYVQDSNICPLKIL